LSFEEELERILRRADEATTPEDRKAVENDFAMLVFDMSAEQFRGGDALDYLPRG
jgi:hypothetical protein